MCGFLDLRNPGGVTRGVLAALTADLGLLGTRPNPMRPVPLVRRDPATGRLMATIATWGWPRTSKPGASAQAAPGIHTHIRHETAADKPTWAQAWRCRRGVIPVAGWWEGTWHVTGTDLHLAVLWTDKPNGPRLAILTQDPGPHAARFERLPIPLTTIGAQAWLGGRDPTDQVRDLAIQAEDALGNRLGSIFD